MVLWDILICCFDLAHSLNHFLQTAIHMIGTTFFGTLSGSVGNDAQVVTIFWNCEGSCRAKETKSRDEYEIEMINNDPINDPINSYPILMLCKSWLVTFCFGSTGMIDASSIEWKFKHGIRTNDGDRVHFRLITIPSNYTSDLHLLLIISHLLQEMSCLTIFLVLKYPMSSQIDKLPIQFAQLRSQFWPRKLT